MRARRADGLFSFNLPRLREVVRHRTAGKTFSEIGEVLEPPCTKQNAMQLYASALKLWKEQNLEADPIEKPPTVCPICDREWPREHREGQA